MWAFMVSFGCSRIDLEDSTWHFRNKLATARAGKPSFLAGATGVMQVRMSHGRHVRVDSAFPIEPEDHCDIVALGRPLRMFMRCSEHAIYQYDI